jgi:hypothetical protein
LARAERGILHPIYRVLAPIDKPTRRDNLERLPAGLTRIGMTKKRGREARLKSEHATLYPGIEPGAWMPVETLLRHITDLIHHDRSKSGVITGTRLLHEEHFEYRGSSARPEGLPAGSTRLADASVPPGQLDPAGSVAEREPARKRGHQT